MNPIKPVYQFIVDIPRWFGYDPVRARRDGIGGPDFWLREGLHYIGGYLVGRPFRSRSRPCKMTVWIILVGVNIAVEAYQAHHGQIWYKTVIDPSMWWLGFIRGARPFRS